MNVPSAPPKLNRTSVPRGRQGDARIEDRAERDSRMSLSSSQVPQRDAASAGQIAQRRRNAYRAFYVAGAAVALSAMLPWVSVLGVINAHPTGGQILIILAFAAAYGGAGYLTRAQKVTLTMLIGTWVLNTLLGLMVIAFYSSFGETGGIAGPAIGLFVAGLGVIVGSAATIQAHRSR